MLIYLTAAGLVLHTFFWGAGLAWLALPRVWRRWWWVFAPGFGLALQSAVVWAGAHTPLAGTDAYARASEVLPAATLGVALWRAGRAIAGLRLRQLGGGAGVGVILLVAGWLLLSPMTRVSRWPTSTSLGSCDHADYAAGARVLQEFAHDDRTGFLGLPEVTRIRSVEYFFDFWLRLNHFTPSALLAHHGTVFDLEPYRLVSVLAVGLLLCNVPVTLFLARVAVGLRGGAALLVAAVYAISPLGAYAAHQGALGQLLAAQGIALVTLAVMGGTLAAERKRSVGAYLPLTLSALWILAGSYNFILAVALAPAGVWLAGRLWLRRNGRAAGQTVAMLAGAAAACAALFWERFAGLKERFSLFEQYNFGWPVPVLSPEGWFGLVATVELSGWPPAVRAVASVLLLSALGLALCKLGRRQPVTVLGALALAGPALLGWALLAWESRARANASYDAFKLLSVFYPGLLAGLCCWLRLAEPAAAGRRRERRQVALVSALAAVVLAGNLFAADRFRRRMENPPLRVDRALAEVGKLEDNPQVGSLNMRVADFWSRLWANAFLLKKPQYFPTHTYEGRKNTALKGEWDLQDEALCTLPFRLQDFVVINGRFYAVRTSATGLIRAEFGDGWHAEERLGAEHWRWTAGPGSIELQNPQAQPVRARLLLRVRGLTPRELTLSVNEGGSTWRYPLDGRVQTVEVGNFTVPPGRSRLVIDSPEPPASDGPGGGRRLNVALYGFQLRPLALVGAKGGE